MSQAESIVAFLTCFLQNFSGIRSLHLLLYSLWNLYNFFKIVIDHFTRFFSLQSILGSSFSCSPSLSLLSSLSLPDSVDNLWFA